jgi:5'-3' exonuclease
MGIPSYFSYIIKNYANIIRKFDKCEKFDHLFIDCNSIIYDSYYRLIKNSEQNNSEELCADFEKILIHDVIETIKEYLRFISPTKTVFIAFDGVPPFAKMDQQRIRRYKTQHMSEIQNKTSSWNTTAITPGTDFMNALNKSIYKEFKGKHKKWGLQKLWVSCADEPGEGEHKLFECLRKNNFEMDSVAVYGLDSDLIMLSIFHYRKHCKTIEVFREAPEFRTVLSADFEPKERLFLDVGQLVTAISTEMRVDIEGVYDYIFMCFFLGNDFMPHFPGFNIRTHGIQVLTETYSKLNKHFMNDSVGTTTKTKSRSTTINWKVVDEYVKELGRNEYDYLLTEYNSRDKLDRRHWTENTAGEREQILHNLPIIYRADEKYISPSEDGWETRYYRVLFGIEDIAESDICAICMNYLEGLEWVFNYYTDKCLDWRWTYRYNYPPLMKDLARYVLAYESKWNYRAAFSSDLQLAYVLPRAKLNLSKHCEFLLEKYSENYPVKYEYQWAFCRYFWEAHPLLPSISMVQLEKLSCELLLL